MMFYKENDISEHLKCPYCKNKYKDPRIVECSTSFCMLCIEILTKEGENGFKCPVCESFHEIPPKGYLKNFNLDQISDKKANPLSRGSPAASLKTQLDEFKLKLDVLVNEEELGIVKLKDYCDSLRNEVQLASEQAIQDIKNINSYFIDYIESFENGSYAYYEVNEEEKAKFDKHIEEMYACYSKWTDYLNQFKIDDHELKTASFQVNICLEQINKEHTNLMTRLCSGNVLKFVRNTNEVSSSTIGQLFEDVRVFSIEEKLNNLKVYSLREQFSRIGAPQRQSIRVQCLTSGKFCLAYFNYEDRFQLELAMFDDASLDVLSTNSASTEGFIRNYFKMDKLRNSIIICFMKHLFAHESDYYEDNIDTSTIKKFDDGLNKVKELNVNYVIRSIRCFESHLYCLGQTLSGSQIYVYGENLEHVMRFGQGEDLSNPYFVSNSIINLEICDQYYVFFKNFQVMFMNRCNGMIEKQFDLNLIRSRLFDFNGPSLFSYYQSKLCLVKHDLDGGSSQEIALDALGESVKKSMELVDCFNGRFIFFDRNSLSLIF